MSATARTRISMAQRKRWASLQEGERSPLDRGKRCPVLSDYPDFLAHQSRVFDRHTEQAEIARLVIRRKGALWKWKTMTGASPWHIFAYSGRSGSNA